MIISIVCKAKDSIVLYCCWMSEARPYGKMGCVLQEKELRREKGGPRNWQKTDPLLSVLTVHAGPEGEDPQG